MKDEGTLTNSEVLAVLQDREADKEPVVSKAKPSEIQVRPPTTAACLTMPFERRRRHAHPSPTRSPCATQAYSALVERGALQHTVEQQQACVAALKVRPARARLAAPV